MRLLLDTHIWIWSMVEPDRLPKKIASALRNDENELWLSPISLWELWVLVQKNRIALAEDFHPWVSRALSQASFREAPITNEVIMEIPKLEFSHRDPADHFIAASARVFDLTLVTADPHLLKLKSQGLSVLAAS